VKQWAAFAKWSALLYAVVLVGYLGSRISTATIPFDTDEADHAVAGLEVYSALRSRDLSHVYHALTRQGFYPPVHSLLISASYLLSGGPGFASSRMPSLVMFAAAAVLAVAVLMRSRASQHDGAEAHERWLAAAWIAWLFVTSPLIVVNSVLCMLEIMGCALLCVLLLCCIRIERDERMPRAVNMLLVGGILAVLTLTKYTFGLFMTIGCTGAVLLTSSKNMPLQKRGQLCVLLLAPVVVTACAWCVLSDWHSIKGFFTSHPAYTSLLSVENLFFYPAVILTEYHIQWTVGSIVLLLAAYGAVKQWGSFVVRACAISILAAMVVLTISTTNEARHILVVMPCVWLLAGLGLLCGWCRLRLALSSKGISGFPVAVAPFVLIWIFLPFRLPDLPDQITAAWEGTPELAAMLNPSSSVTPPESSSS